MNNNAIVLFTIAALITVRGSDDQSDKTFRSIPHACHPAPSRPH
jgi:hypothetical protein